VIRVDGGSPEPVGTKDAVCQAGGVILLSPFPWEGVRQTTHYMAEQFARYVPTLYVEPRVSWYPDGGDFDWRRLVQGFGPRRVSEVAPSLHVLRASNFPLGRIAAIEKQNERALIGRIRAAGRRLRLERPLLWVSYYAGCLAHVRALGPAPYVYHCLDHFEHGDREEEAALTRGARMVFAVSRPLVERHERENPNTRLLPNGVAIEWYQRPDGSPLPVPDDLPPASPRLGFVGIVSRHVDLALLLEVARAFPSASLVIVGPIGGGSLAPAGRQREALDQLRARSNVTFLGLRPAEDLPGYISGFDVCLIPSLPDDFVAHSDPLKFYQYLAAGKPIVTTPVPLTDRNAHLCYVAGGHREFVEQIEAALRERPGAFREVRLARAREHSWSTLVSRHCGHFLPSPR
jgi:glycosyltransferase involved in cell wall biosynthesis